LHGFIIAVLTEFLALKACWLLFVASFLWVSVWKAHSWVKRLSMTPRTTLSKTRYLMNFL